MWLEILSKWESTKERNKKSLDNFGDCRDKKWIKECRYCKNDWITEWEKERKM